MMPATSYRVDEEDADSRNDLLVANAATREKDWNWLTKRRRNSLLSSLRIETEEIGMISFQGPATKNLLEKIVKIPDPWRNRLKISRLNKIWTMISRTGYTGEPLCFEIFIPSEKVENLCTHTLRGRGRWDCSGGSGWKGQPPVGSGPRLIRERVGPGCRGEGDSYLCHGASGQSGGQFLSFKGEFIGREALRAQFEEVKTRGRTVIPFPQKERGSFARVSCLFLSPVKELRDGVMKSLQTANGAGHVTSGTMVSYWVFSEAGILGKLTDERRMRPIGLAYMDSDLEEGQKIEIQYRGKNIHGLIVEKRTFLRKRRRMPILSSFCRSR